MNRFCQIIAFALLLVFGVTAFAGTRSTDQEISVTFADLNVSNELGAEVLYTRLKSAADSVCGVVPGRQPLSIRQARENCAQETLDSLVERVGNQALTRVHSS